MALLAVLRVRGHAKIKHAAVETMDMMRLNRVNHCVLVKESKSANGMLQVVKDYVTWGEIGPEGVARMLFQKGEVVGGKRLTDSYVKENSKYTSILSFAKALETGEASFSDVKGLKPVIRLPPPRKGYESTRLSYVDGGSLGYRGKEMWLLIDRMLEKPKEAK